MDIFEVFDKRYSCRKYIDKKVDEELIDKIIDAARRAPSACNCQPWRFIAVTDPEKVKKIAKATQKGGIGINKFADKVPAFIVIVRENPSVLNRVAKLVSSHDYVSNDIGIASATMTYAATALGLGSCIMGWFDDKKVCEALDIPKGREPQLILSLGYPEGEGRNPQKRELNEVRSFNTYFGDVKEDENN